MTKQKTILGFVASIAIGALLVPAAVVAQQREPGASATIGTTATAKVTAIDPEKRIVTVQDSDGKQLTLTCSKEVVNFDQIKVGDEVKAATMSRLVVSVGKDKASAAAPGAEATTVIARATKGAMPGAIISSTEQVVAKVDAVDAEKQTVTLSGIDAEPQTVKVSPDVDLSAVKQGDDVTIRVTKGVALWVTRPSAGEARDAAREEEAKLAGFTVAPLNEVATVEAIDPEKRIVSLKAPDGAKRSVRLGEQCINFDQIEVGDKVRATMAEEAAIAVFKPGAAPRTQARQVTALAPKGAKPRVVVADAIDLTGQIKSIDADKRTITLTAADGSDKTVKADEKVNLSELKAGDTVTARVTQVMAIVVEKP